ncbi:MAG: chromate transporter [Xanthobacteraceae bacterium]
MLDSRLIGLIIVFAPLSLLSFGGGQAIVADIQYQTVEVHKWLTNSEFVDMFALSRASPGPSTLISALIGWQVAAFPGALVAALAMYVPSSILVYGASSWWQRSKESPVRIAIERGLAPVAIGLIFAGIVAVVQAAKMDALSIATLAVATGILYFTKFSSYRLLFIVAAFYGALLYFGYGAG